MFYKCSFSQNLLKLYKCYISPVVFKAFYLTFCRNLFKCVWLTPPVRLSNFCFFFATERICSNAHFYSFRSPSRSSCPSAVITSTHVRIEAVLSAWSWKTVRKPWTWGWGAADKQMEEPDVTVPSSTAVRANYAWSVWESSHKRYEV